jgi:hypothetical protein
MRMSLAFVTCAWILVSCGGESSSNTGLHVEPSSQSVNAADGSAQPSPIEDVYVARARFSSPNLPVTSFCDAAHFPRDYPVERERYYEYWSTTGRPTDGLVTAGSVQRVGGHHGCYSVNKNRTIYSYMTGTFAGIPFAARGTCVFNPERAPKPDVSPYTCNYSFSDLPQDYVGGQATWNGVTTGDPGYLTTTIGTIRLWKQRASR